MDEPDSWEVPDLDRFGISCKVFVRHYSPSMKEVQDILLRELTADEAGDGLCDGDLGVFMI